MERFSLLARCGGTLLVWFVGLAYLLSWWSAPFADGALIPYGPTLAALIMIAATKGRPGLAELGRRLTSWEDGGRWLLLAPGLVIVYLSLAFGASVLLGVEISSTAHLGAAGGTILTLLLLGGWWEEPGWSGYALPLLQDRHAGRPFGLLKASLTMGLIRSGWHLPLVVSGHIPWYDAVIFSFAFQFLVSWLFNRTGGSVLPPMLFHLTSNVVGGALILPMFVGADFDRYYLLFIACACMLAIALNAPQGWSMGRRNAPTGCEEAVYPSDDDPVLRRAKSTGRVAR